MWTSSFLSSTLFTFFPFFGSQVAIIGGGPHALAVLSALHERSYASPQFKDDAAYALRVGFDSHKLVGSVAVIDPGKKFCDMWHKRFLSLGYECDNRM